MEEINLKDENYSVNKREDWDNIVHKMERQGHIEVNVCKWFVIW